MNDVSHHEATMRFLYGYAVRKNISPPARCSQYKISHVPGAPNDYIDLYIICSSEPARLHVNISVSQLEMLIISISQLEVTQCFPSSQIVDHCQITAARADNFGKQQTAREAL